MADPVQLGPAAQAWLQTPAGKTYLQRSNSAVTPSGQVVSQPHGASIDWGPLSGAAHALGSAWDTAAERVALPFQTVFGGGGGGGGGQPKPTTPAGGAGSTTAPPNAQTAQPYYNPLAASGFINQIMAPIYNSLASQFNTWNQGFANQITNGPFMSSLTPDQQAQAHMQAAMMGQQANNVSEAMIGAAQAAPGLDALTNSMNVLSQRALQSYTESLKNTTNQQLAAGAIFNANQNLATSAASGQPLNLKGSVANQQSLPIVGNQVGDAYTTTDNGKTYQWDGTNWNATS